MLAAARSWRPAEAAWERGWLAALTASANCTAGSAASSLAVRGLDISFSSEVKMLFLKMLSTSLRVSMERMLLPFSWTASAGLTLAL